MGFLEGFLAFRKFLKENTLIMGKKSKYDTEKKSKQSSEIRSNDDEPNGPEIRVSDKRFWVKKDWDPGDRSETRKPTYVNKLENRIKQSEKTINDVREAARKFRDEGESFRQRLERDIDRKVANSRAQFLSDMIEVLDNIERSLQIAQKNTNDSPAFSSLMEGLKMVHLLFLEKMARQGVEPMELLEKPYDPEWAEALEVIETDDPEKDNLIVKVFQKAYRMDDRCLRPGRVKVSQSKNKEAAKEPQEEPKEDSQRYKDKKDKENSEMGVRAKDSEE